MPWYYKIIGQLKHINHLLIKPRNYKEVSLAHFVGNKRRTYWLFAKKAPVTPSREQMIDILRESFLSLIGIILYQTSNFMADSCQMTTSQHRI